MSKPEDRNPPAASLSATKSSKKKAAFDARSRRLLLRFMEQWVFPRWRALVVALLLMLGLAAVSALYPLVIKLSFDTLMNDKDANLSYVLAAVIGITMARSLFLFFQTISVQRIVHRLATDLQKKAFTHLIHADLSRLGRETTGRFVSRLTNDIAFIQQAVLAGLNTAVRDILMIIAFVGSMIYLDWIMSLIVLCVYPIAALPIVVISERLRRVAKRTQAELGDMTSLLTEKVSGARLIKSFQLEDYASERVNNSFETVFSLKMKAVRARARLDPMLEALGGLAVAGVIGFAYWRISSGVTTVGDFMGFISALLLASQPIRALGNLSGRVQEGLAAAENFYNLLDEVPSIKDRPGVGDLKIKDGTIRFEDVSFVYASAPDQPAISGFSLEVPGGKTVALVGRSGAGKSTILNLVPRLYDCTGGRILVDDQDTRDVSLVSLRARVAIVSQDVTLFDDSIRANIALGRLDASEDDIIASAKAAAAHEFIAEQPDGYDTQIGDQGMRLSGGQRQRLALARAILKDAPILLLDEATSALDTASEKLVQDALKRFTKNRTTLVVAHRLSTVRDADLICVLDQGLIVETGTHDELMEKSGAYAALAQSQLVSD